MKTLKKIALLTDGIHPYVIGGMQKHSFYLAKYFSGNKIYVDLYHTPGSGTYDADKLEFFTGEEKQFIRPFLIDFPPGGFFPGHYIRESYSYSCELFNILKENMNVDFIYAKGFTAWKLIEEKKKGFACPPVGVKFHGLEMFQHAPSIKEKISQYLFRSPTLYNLRNADHVFSYGGKITETLLGRGIEKKKIMEVPTGISSDWLLENGPGVEPGVRVKFLFIGRYERRKGIEELNRAIKNIIEKNDFEFHFVGPIPENKKINSQKIKYRGTIADKDQLQEIIRQLDVLVCPSHSEGMPNVILEGMASGLAVIATDVGAVSELVSAQNGWLLGSAGVSEIEQAMISAIRCNKDGLNEKKRCSKIIIKNNFLWEKIITRTIHEIEKII